MKDVYKTLFFLAVITNLIGPFVSSFTNHSEDCDLVDVVFLIPTSDDVSKSEITDLQRMLLFLLRGMPVAESQTRFGVVSYGDEARAVAHLSGDRMSLGRSVLKIHAVGGSSNPRGGLNIAYNLLTNDKRYAIPQIAVIVHKNVSSSSLALARLQANKMADADIRLITIGIGPSDLNRLAWAENLAYSMASSQDLLSITRDIPKYICKAIHSPRPLTQTTDEPVTLSMTTGVPKEVNEVNIEETPTVCDKAHWVNGVGYASVEGNPESFAMCYRGLHNVMTVSYKTCPVGQQWSEPDVTCIKVSRLENPSDIDPCANGSRGTRADKRMGCRAYLICDGGKSVQKCCPSKMSYQANTGCVWNPSCIDKCYPVEAEKAENNAFCQLLPIEGHPDKFKQLTATGVWQEFDCPDGTAFSKDSCGCARFRPAQYMAKQQQGPNTCTPDLYLPFCGDLKDFSGKETYVQRIGHVRLREGKAYLDGRSSLYIPRFSGLEYGDTIVIQFKYLADDDDDDGIDRSNGGEEFSLISNGRCDDYYCEAPSISIRSRDDATVLQTSSTGDDVTIISVHSRRRRATEDEEDDFSDLVSHLDEESNVNKESIKLYRSNLTSNDSQDEENSKEILSDIQKEYEGMIPENSSSMDDEMQVDKRPVLFGPLSLLTETADNDFDIILEPFDIRIPTTTVKIATTGNGIGKNTDREDRVPKHEDTSVKNDQENTDDITDTTNDDHVPNYDIILDNTDGTNLINEVIGFNSEESIGNTLIPDDDAKILNNEIDKVKNNFVIIFDGSSSNIDDLIDDIKDADKNNDEKTVRDHQNNESKEVYDNGTISDIENINEVKAHKIDDEEVFEHPKNQNDTSREEIGYTVDSLSVNVSNIGIHDNHTNSPKEDASTGDLIKHLNVEIKEENGHVVDTQLDTSETSKEDLVNNGKTLTFNYSISDVKKKLEDIIDDISVEGEVMDTPKDVEDKSMEENETNTIYNTKSETLNSEEENETNTIYNTKSETLNSEEENETNTIYNTKSETLNSEEENETYTIYNTKSETLNSEEENETNTIYNTKSETLNSEEENETNTIYNTKTEENETNTIYNTKSESLPSKEENESGYSLDTEYDTVSSKETNGNNTNNKGVVGLVNNEGLKNESSKDAGADNWRIVTMKIKDGVIQVSINGRTEDDRFFRGRIKTTQSGLYIGSGTGGKNFKGYIDEVYIFLCDPDLETEEQKYRTLLHDRRQQQSANGKRNAGNPQCDYLNPRAQDWLRDRK